MMGAGGQGVFVFGWIDQLDPFILMSYTYKLAVTHNNIFML